MGEVSGYAAGITRLEVTDGQLSHIGVEFEEHGKRLADTATRTNKSDLETSHDDGEKPDYVGERDV